MICHDNNPVQRRKVLKICFFMLKYIKIFFYFLKIIFKISILKKFKTHKKLIFNKKIKNF